MFVVFYYVVEFLNYTTYFWHCLGKSSIYLLIISFIFSLLWCSIFSGIVSKYLHSIFYFLFSLGLNNVWMKETEEKVQISTTLSNNTNHKTIK